MAFFYRNVDLCFASQGSYAVSDRLHFGMLRGIGQFLGLIAAAADDFGVPHQDRADGQFFIFCRVAAKLSVCAFHEIMIRIQIALHEAP
jgi:hypothetical protein